MMEVLKLLNYNSGYGDLPCIREATQTPNNDENAWAWGWPLLDYILFVLPYFLHSIYDCICHFWIHHRYDIKQ